MNVMQAYEMFMQDQKFKGNSPYTLIYYRDTLLKFINFCGSDLDIEDLDIILFKSYQLYIYENFKVNKTSVQTYSRAVKVFYRYLYFENLIDVDINRLQLMKANKDVILPLSDKEIKSLLSVFDNSMLITCRNKTMIMLMLDCGLRLGEVVKLKVSDIDLINGYCLINGKGSKQRVVPLGSALSGQLAVYMEYRTAVTSDSKSLFLTIDNRSITENTVKMLFARIKMKDGLKRVYPHLLRHTFDTNFIFTGGNLEVLRVLMGHSTINITQVYIHLATQKHLKDSYNSYLDKLLF